MSFLKYSIYEPDAIVISRGTEWAAHVASEQDSVVLQHTSAVCDCCLKSEEIKAYLYNLFDFFLL
jgi:hypothetical protein